MKKLIIANQKMYFDLEGAINWAKQVKENLKSCKNDVVVCPDFVSLCQVAGILKGTRVMLGAQDVCQNQSGKQTGEVSAKTLCQAGAMYVIVGHSERRANFGESSVVVRAKMHSALENKLVPIVCLPFDGKGAYKAAIKKELKLLLEGCRQGVVLAFEPSWAIGSGISMEPKKASRVLGFIKAEAEKITGCGVRVLYGGSVSEKSAADYLALENVDGLLLGTAAKDPIAFCNIASL